MKTTLPDKIRTYADAVKFLLELYRNDELYHLDDDAADIVDLEGKPLFTPQEAAAIEPLMKEVFDVCPDPFEICMNLIERGEFLQAMTSARKLLAEERDVFFEGEDDTRNEAVAAALRELDDCIEKLLDELLPRRKFRATYKTLIPEPESPVLRPNAGYDYVPFDEVVEAINIEQAYALFAGKDELITHLNIEPLEEITAGHDREQERARFIQKFQEGEE